MGAADFFVGVGSRLTNALMINWFLSIFLLIASLIYILPRRNVSKLVKDIKSNKGLLISMCLFDNFAWISFAFALILAPIAIAVALSQSFIIITVLLGMYISKEKMRVHQKFGLILAILSAIILAVISTK